MEDISSETCNKTGAIMAKKKGADGKECWDGYRYGGTENGKDKCIKVEAMEEMSLCKECALAMLEDIKAGKFNDVITEAEYQGRKVPLGKPMRGDIKKFKVYVKNPEGNVVKVNFGHGGTSAKRAGQKTMRIKKNNPARRKSFVLDTIATILDLEPKQDIGLVENGKKVYVPVGFL